MNKAIFAAGAIAILFAAAIPVNADHPTNTDLDPYVTYNDIIPQTDYTSKGLGKQYPPVGVANKCLFYFSYVRNATAWEYGEYVAKWLALRAKPSGDSVYFTYDFAWPTYGMDAGWKSGLAQGKVAECFIKAYSYTGNSTFLDLAKRSLLYLQVPLEQGGVMIEECHDRWWFEEYASTTGKRSYVLNGHQFALLSLNKYLIIDNDPEIRQIFDNGANALKFDSMLYDNGTNNSFYDRLRGPAGKYHNTHIINSQLMYDITKDPAFLEIKKAFMN